MWQLTEANQPAYSAAGGPGSKPYFTVGGTPYLVGFGTADRWAFLHTGAFTAWVVFRVAAANPNNVTILLGTSVSGGANPGSSLCAEDRGGSGFNDTLGLASYGSGGVKRAYATAPNGSVTPQTWVCGQWTFDPASTTSLILKVGGVVLYNAAGAAFTPDPANPAVAQIGRTGSIVTGGPVDIARMTFLDRAATVSDEAAMRAIIYQDYGLTA